MVRRGKEWAGEGRGEVESDGGGVERHNRGGTGRGTSSPRPSGYNVPTMLEYARRYDDPQARVRGKRMLDWLVSIQLPEGGFQGGRIDSTPVVPVTFNTGQILLGLAAGTKEFGDEYRPSMQAAADWLVKTQDDDGCWRSHATPFAKPGEKAYETHVAWGLLEAARLAPDAGYGEAALRNNDWALTQQQDNGWFDNCCLNDKTQPYTHTLGYVLRGILEAHKFSGHDRYLAAAIKLADPLLENLDDDGFLPGRFNENWQATAEWSCLTGTVQIAHCWLLLYGVTNDVKYRDAAQRANRFVRRTVLIDGPPETRGAVKGSFPIGGEYGGFEYLNWAVKFCIDANFLELDAAAN